MVDLRAGALMMALLLSMACDAHSSGTADPAAEPPPKASAEAAGGRTKGVDVEATSDGAEGGRVSAVETVEQLRVEVLAVYPHDPNAFTQGLVWDGGIFYESTGLYGRSSVRRVDPSSGRVLVQRLLDPGLFGEGLTLVGDRLICLTWHAGVALVLELSALEIVDQFEYRGEGWGLAYDGTHLVMSDGSHRLTFRDPETFAIVSTLEVTEGGRPVEKLNELEVVGGQIYANVWSEEILVRIDPETGKVTARIDASGLLEPSERSRTDVLNGIAYDRVSETFWITGKLWPKVFQVRFVAVGD